MTGQRIPFYVVDAFTDTPFGGNPAAVCLDIDTLSNAGMQQIAREMNLSETAFLYEPDAAGLRRLRWFTPAVEVPLCGHATLASAHVILRELGGSAPVRFATASGVLTVVEDGPLGLAMDFPADPAGVQDPPPGLEEALGLAEDGVRYLTARNLAVVVLEREDQVMDLEPDFGALARVGLEPPLMGVSVTARAMDGSADFVSRFFAPWVGVDEDPVTGVAHTVLAPFWATELGKAQLDARQGSSRRGFLTVRSRDSRVDLVGHATTVAHGRILRPA